MVELVIVRSEEELAAADRLFREYADSLDFDLCFQDFEHEIASLPGAYGAPGGRLRLAVRDGEPIGCVAIRGLKEGVCEMKRIYVRPAFRGIGIGRMLAVAGIQDARELGYKAIRLDTVPSMVAATALYRSLGFVEVEPYRYNPIPGAVYMELALE